MKNVIYARHSHYEIPDYTLGDAPRLEEHLTLVKLIRYGNRKFYKREIFSYYDEETSVLYVPRGYDSVMLAQETNRYIVTNLNCNTPVQCNYRINVLPLNDFQREAIRFLSGMEEFHWTKKHSQLVLSIPTRSGKTYCTVVAGSLLEKKLLIIVKSVDLRNQWKDDIKVYTDLDSEIKIIDSSNTLDKFAKMSERKRAGHYIYLVTIQTLNSYMSRFGMEKLNEQIKNLGIGIKVYDEAHKEFKNILKLDYALNVWKTFYITATFGRSDYVENKIFERCFDKVAILKKRDETKRRHTHFIAIAYFAYVEDFMKGIIFRGTTFNRFRYIEYEIEAKVILEKIEWVISNIVIAKQLEGKILILSSSKSSCDYFYEFICELLPKYSICVHYDGNKKDDFRDYGIICATPQMLGTGMTIPGLRMIINTEPTSSKINIVQYFGRLAEFAPDKDSYYIELFNKAYDKMMKWYRIRKNALKMIAKTETLVDTTIIKDKKE